MARLVLHIHDLGLGGAERVTLDWLSWLQQAGHEVWLLLVTRSAPPSPRS